MKTSWFVLALVGCGSREVDPTVDKLPGSPFLSQAGSKGTSGGSGFQPYAFGVGATWGVEDGELSTWQTADGAIEDAVVTLFLFEWEFIQDGSTDSICRVQYPVDEGDPLVERFDYPTFTTGVTGPWTARGFTVTLDATTASTDCSGVDTARWGAPVDMLDGATLGLGATTANDDVLGSLVPSGADLSRFAGGAVQWDLFTRYEDLTSDTYQLGSTSYFADGTYAPGSEDAYTGTTLGDGAYHLQPTLILVADALEVALD